MRQPFVLGELSDKPRNYVRIVGPRAPNTIFKRVGQQSRIGRLEIVEILVIVQGA